MEMKIEHFLTHELKYDICRIKNESSKDKLFKVGIFIDNDLA
jgi:hypothetical protein